MRNISLWFLAVLFTLSISDLKACCHVDNVTDTTLLVNGKSLAPSSRMNIPKGTTVEVTYQDHNSCPCSGSDCDGTCITFTAGCDTISGGKVPFGSDNGWDYSTLHHVNWCE